MKIGINKSLNYFYFKDYQCRRILEIMSLKGKLVSGPADKFDIMFAEPITYEIDCLEIIAILCFNELSYLFYQFLQMAFG